MSLRLVYLSLRGTFHSLWRAWLLRISAHAKADNISLLIASLHKLVEGLWPILNVPPNHNPPMRNKAWQLTMLSQTMKELQTGTTTYIHNCPEGILVRSWMGGTALQSSSKWSPFHGPGGWWHCRGDTSKSAFSPAELGWWVRLQQQMHYARKQMKVLVKNNCELQ
jgi:hypothetical protein